MCGIILNLMIYSFQKYMNLQKWNLLLYSPSVVNGHIYMCVLHLGLAKEYYMHISLYITV